MRLEAAALFFAGTISAGCVFLVDTDDVGSTCHFAGESQACGACIAKSCQSTVNSCCGNIVCSTLALSELDACARGEGCSHLESSAPDVAACIESHCPACGGADGGASSGNTGVGSGGSFQSSCISGDGYCSCSGAGSASQVKCDSTTVVNAVCCADINYPLKNNDCSCRTYACMLESNGATCSAGFTDKGTHSYATGMCCNSGSTCTCDTAATQCYGSDVSVAACTAAVAGCRSGQRRVDACSY